MFWLHAHSTASKKMHNVTKIDANMKGSNKDGLPFYQDTVRMSVPLPEAEVFAPVVNVRVFDERPRFKVLVGSAAISIAPYLPWNKGKSKQL